VWAGRSGKLPEPGADIGALGRRWPPAYISRLRPASLRRSTAGPGLLPAVMFGPEENGAPQAGAMCASVPSHSGGVGRGGEMFGAARREALREEGEQMFPP
jgi:hypothetical protein